MAKDTWLEPCVDLWLWKRRDSCHLSHHGQPLPAAWAQPAQPPLRALLRALSPHAPASSPLLWASSHTACSTHTLGPCVTATTSILPAVTQPPYLEGARARGNAQEKNGCRSSALLNAVRWINPTAQAPGKWTTWRAAVTPVSVDSLLSHCGHLTVV